MGAEPTPTLTSCLDALVIDRMCVEAWTGHANSLFVGTDRDTTGKHAQGTAVTPAGCGPHTLHVQFADWECVRNGVLVVSSARLQHNDDIAVIVGCRALQWQRLASASLLIDWEGGFRVRVTPYAQPRYRDKFAWSIRCPTGQHVLVTCAGAVYTGHDTDRVGDEAPAAGPDWSAHG